MNPLSTRSRLSFSNLLSSLANSIRSRSSGPPQAHLSSCHGASRPCCFGTRACAEASVCSVVLDPPASIPCSNNQNAGINQTAVGECSLSKNPSHEIEHTKSSNAHLCSAQQSILELGESPSSCTMLTSKSCGPHLPKPADVQKPETEETFYRRQLPESLVSFTSPQGRKLFKESLNEGFAESYFNLAGNFTVQSEPAYCGPCSLAMVLNALEVDPGRKWKGVWRWYSDELLKACRAESEIKENGITFDEFLCLGSTHAQVIAKRGKTASREEFLRDIKYVTQRDDIFMVVSFFRPSLDQTGEGHFSPVGAYHPGTNQALVLDSARYKYPSWFCDVDRLYDSLQPNDEETGLPRGYFLIARRGTRMDPCLFPSSESQKNYFSLFSSDSDIECGPEVVDLPERPSDVLPTRITCGKNISCCSSKNSILHS